MRLSPGFLSPHGKSAYQRIEIRYYADKAGVRHGIEPYAYSSRSARSSRTRPLSRKPRNPGTRSRSRPRRRTP